MLEDALGRVETLHESLIAASVYVLVAIIKNEMALEGSSYTFLQILSVRPFEKSSFQTPCWTLTIDSQCRHPLTH
jgi:hypothetical protein